MIEKAIRKHINIYNERYPNKSLDEFIAAVKAEFMVTPKCEHLKELPGGLSHLDYNNPDKKEALVKVTEEMPPILVTEENFGDLLIEGMEQALGHAEGFEDHIEHIKANKEASMGLNPFSLENTKLTKAAKVQKLVNLLEELEEDDEGFTFNIGDMVYSDMTLGIVFAIDNYGDYNLHVRFNPDTEFQYTDTFTIDGVYNKNKPYNVNDLKLFTHYKVGDLVYCKAYNKGIVSNISSCDELPVEVIFTDGSIILFNKMGKSSNMSIAPYNIYKEGDMVKDIFGNIGKVSLVDDSFYPICIDTVGGFDILSIMHYNIKEDDEV